MKNSKKIAAIFLVLGSLYGFMKIHHKPSLVDVSSRIYNLVTPELYTYQWGPNNRLIYIHSDVGIWTPMLLDIHTNTRIRLEALAIPMTTNANSPFADEPLPGGYTGIDCNYAVSSDGRWLLWPVGSCYAVGWQACSLKGKDVRPVFTAPLNGNEQTMTCIQNRNQWLCLAFHADQRYHALLQDYGSHNKPLDIPINWPVGHVVLGCTTDYHLITTESGFEQKAEEDLTAIKIYEAMLMDRGHASVMHTIGFPVKATVLEATLSPSGKQVAWLLKYHDTVGASAVTRLLFSHILHVNTAKFAIWISDITGKHVHEVGQVEDRGAIPPEIDLTDTKPSFLGTPRFIRWQTDGQHISYMYHDALYSVKAEK